MSDSIRKMMEATAARLPGWFVGVHPHFWSYLGEYGATYHVVLTLDAKTQVDAHGTSLPDVLAEAEAKAKAMRRTDPPKDVAALAMSRVPSAPTDTTEGDPS